MNEEPSQNPEEALFHQALELPASERETFLDRACAGDVELRTRLDLWLRLELDVEGYLRRPTVDSVRAVDSEDALIGMQVGSYKILQEIGEGGYGIVYMAEQREPVTRQVALKILKLGMDTKQIVARFEAERQALALMEHPNIAKVFDAGATESGRPYFVMELVRGVPITHYCDQRGLTTDERLELFKQVCLAVQHAHQKGVIHRDLKPNNILVSTNGDQAESMIIDFGIAKATQGRLTDKTLFTHFQQFVGTPEYMSPEQAQMSTVGVDTRSDIYSLGVLLYELLTGKKLLDSAKLRRAGYEEICRYIREDSAPKPSKRLTAIQTEELTTLAKQRSLTPAQFTSSIRGDLDWIVMKAVEKDVSRRYDSCGTLAADIERYRNKLPVLAGPPTADYHLRKFTQRHRATAWAITGIALSLIAGTGIAIYGMLEAISEKEAARKAEAIAQIEKRRAIDLAYLADMQVAHEAVDRNDLALARRILKGNRNFPPDHDPRHWEWRALWQQCQRKAALRFGIEGDHHISSVSISPDGRWAAVGARESIRVWDLSNGELKESLEKQANWCQVAFSPSGDTLYASFESVIRSYEMPTFANRNDVFTHDREVFRMASSPNGQWLAALCRPFNQGHAQLSIWNLETRELHERFEGLATRASGRLDFSRDSRLLGVGLSASVRVIDLETPDNAIVIKARGSVGMAMSPDGQFVASSEGSRLNIHRLGNGEPVRERDEHLLFITDVAYSPDGRLIASAGSDQSVILWDAVNSQKLATFHDLESGANAVHFTPDSRRLLVAGGKSRLYVWDIPEHPQSTWPSHGMQVLTDFDPAHSQVSYSANGKVIAATSREGVTLSSPETPETTRALTDSGCGLRYSPVDPSLIAVGFQEDGTLALFDTTSGEELKRVTVLSDLSSKGQWPEARREQFAVFPVDFSQDGERLLVLARMKSNVSKCVIYRVSDLTEVTSWTVVSKESPAAALSPDGNQVVVAGYWGLRLLTVGQPAENAEVLFKGLHKMNGLDYSPDGRLLAVGGSDKAIYLLDPTTGRIIEDLTGHISKIGALRFSPDGKRLASSGKHIKLWDVATQRELLTLDVEGGSIRQLEWSPDGNAILATSGTVRRWLVPSFGEIDSNRAGQ